MVRRVIEDRNAADSSTTSGSIPYSDAASQPQIATAADDSAAGPSPRYSLFVGRETREPIAVEPFREAMQIWVNYAHSRKNFDPITNRDFRKECYIKTGWWMGVDGKWRIEIPDVKPRMRAGKTSGDMINGLTHNAEDGTSTCMLTDMVKHDKLFDLYPSLKRIRVRIVDPDEVDYTGQYSPSERTINIIWDHVKWIKDEPSNVLTAEGLKTITHEIQHAIQDYEGFSQGGNIEYNGPENYQHLAGEVEARNAERRRSGIYSSLAYPNASENDRKSAVFTEVTAPWQTEDVPTFAQIVYDEQGKMRDLTGRPVARHSVRLDEAKKLMPNTKVVDRNGNPSIMYHGTYWNGRDLPDGEAVFNSSRGIHVGTYEAAVQRITRSDDPEEQELPEDADIIELFVNITNPFIVKGDPFVYEDLAAREFIRLSKERKLPKNDEFDSMVQNQDIPSVISYLKSIGYDGIKYRNSIEDRGSTSWVAFEPNQVKEASVWNKSRMDLNNKDFRHSVRVPGSNTNRIALKHYLAREIVENGRLPDHRHAAFVARSMGVSASDIPSLINEARTEADEQTKALRYVAGDPKVEKAISRAGLSYRYENAIRRARRTAIKYSRDVSEAQASADRSMNRAIRAVKGEDYNEMLVRDGIDINAILKAMRPAETAPSATTGEASGTDGSGSAAEPATPTPETEARGQEAARRAIERATELVRRAKEQLAARKDDEPQPTGARTRTDDEEGDDGEGAADEPADTNAGLIDKAFRQAIAESGITLDSPAAVVQLVRAITENYITENPATVSDLDPDDIFASPIARAMLSGNIASFAQAVAAAYSPSHARIRIARKSQLLNDRSVNSLAAIERIGEEIFRDLNRDIIRQSRNSLIREIKKIVTDPAKHFAERVENKDRTISADAAQYCKFARWAINVPASKVEETAAELETFLQGYGAGEISDKDKARYRDYAEAQMKLSLLDTFANLRDRMPADLVQIRDFVGQLVDEGKFDAMCFSEKWEQTRKAVVDAALPGIAGDPKNKGRQPENTSVLYSLVGMMEPKWQQLTRFCRDNAVRDRSRQAMATVEEMIQTANDREYNYLSDGKRKLNDLLVATYGSFKAAQTALSEDVHESLWADLDRGDQRTEWTIGRVMQMYVSCVQSDYADNTAKWNRGNDYVALLEQIITDADPRHMDLIRGLRQLYLEQGEALSEVTLKTAGVPIRTPNRNYMPVVTMNDHNIAKKAEARAYSPFAPSLTPRVKHGLDFDQTADIIDVFTDRLQDAAHTIGWADTGSLVMGICQSDDMLNAIRQAHGRAAMSQWNNYILDVVAGTQERRAGREANFAHFLARLASRTWIALNPISWTKQLESFPCFALCNDGRLRDVGRDIGFWALHPMLGLQAARDLARTKAFSARYGLEISQELKYATSDEGAFKSWWGRTMDKAMSGVYTFDKLGVYMLAGIYRRRRAELERDGMSTDEASETAASWLMHIVDKTAQTARTVNTTQLQRAGGAWAFVLQFKSAPAQQTQFEIAALQDAIAAPNDAKRWKKAAAVICINHLIVPTINTAIEGLLMMLTNLGLPDEEKRKRLAALFAANVLSGSLGSIAFLGTAIEGLSRAASEYAIEGRTPNAYTLMGQPIPAFTLIEHWANSYNKATKAFEELQWGDIENGVIDMALAIGAVIPGLSWASRTTEKIKKSAQEK